MAIKYVYANDWLVVRWKDNNETYPPLPKFLKVNLIETKNNRDYFKVLEGINKDRYASVKRLDSGDSWLQNGSHDPAGEVYYNKRKGELWWGEMSRNKSGIPCRIYPDNPPPTGLFNLEIPYEVHSLGSGYTHITPYATTWFRTGHEGDRFLHPGAISRGCVTVTDIKEWDGIYAYLIDRRKGDDKSVGTIKVFE